MRILVAGAGYVGEALADRLHADGHDVVALTHLRESAADLQARKDYIVRPCDIGDADSLSECLADVRPSVFDVAVHCASSGRKGEEHYRSVYLQGCRNLTEQLAGARLLFTSSTSVYAQTDRSWVDENSPARPARETGKILLQAEDVVLDAGGTVVRLGGIYGPGRSYILLKFLTGEAVIEGDGGRYLNQVHRDDVVSGLRFLISRTDANGIFNLVDSAPQRQREVFAMLADYFQMPLPLQAPPDYERKRGWTHKRVSNAKLRSLGWEPAFPSFERALREDPELVASIRQAVTDRAG